jgi:hypothetical protein
LIATRVAHTGSVTRQHDWLISTIEVMGREETRNSRPDLRDISQTLRFGPYGSMEVPLKRPAAGQSKDLPQSIVPRR